jgi:hypothetical protein
MLALRVVAALLEVPQHEGVTTCARGLSGRFVATHGRPFCSE